MMIDWLVTGGALLSGLLGGLHCAAMCGGIASGISAGFQRSQAWSSSLALNAGRIAGYAVAGTLAGGLGAGIVQLSGLTSLQLSMRVLVGAVLIIAALRVMLPRLALGSIGWGARVWQTLRPLSSALLPANTLPRQLALGALWGWLPCGLSATLLTAAWFSADPLQGGLIMLAFGIGTLAAMLPLTYSGTRLSGLLRARGRVALGSMLLLSGLLTASAPWLSQHPAIHGALAALGCRTTNAL